MAQRLRTPHSDCIRCAGHRTAVRADRSRRGDRVSVLVGKAGGRHAPARLRGRRAAHLGRRDVGRAGARHPDPGPLRADRAGDGDRQPPAPCRGSAATTRPPAKPAERFAGDGRWYLTGGTGRVDEDGSYYFTARDDDVILAVGYRIGPFDVERVLITQPPGHRRRRGRPPRSRGDPGRGGRDALGRELQDLVRDTYTRHAYPWTVHFVDALPQTPSGRIQRFLLREK